LAHAAQRLAELLEELVLYPLDRLQQGPSSG
jgi:hypothetical protein